MYCISTMSTQNTSSIISSIYKSRQVILDLMKRQGYKTEEYSNFSINEVNAMFQNEQLDILLEKNAENDTTTQKKKIYIRYYLGKTLSSQNIQDMMDDLFHLEEVLTKNDTLMIITKNEMNETMMNTLKHIWEQDGIFIIIQSLKRLQFNILEHQYVPEHVVLTEAEQEEVLKKYNITDTKQMPSISRYDPVALAIGLRPGHHNLATSHLALEPDFVSAKRWHDLKAPKFLRTLQKLGTSKRYIIRQYQLTLR